MINTKIDPTKLYDSDDMQKLLKISENQLTRLVKTGRLEKTKVGRRYIWTGEQILRSLATPATMRPTGISTTDSLGTAPKGLEVDNITLTKGDK